MTDIAVRPATGVDLAACAAIYARALPLAFPAITRSIHAAAFAADTEGEKIFVALSENAIIGFAAYYAPGNFLHHLYVDPSHQRRGAGSALLSAVQNHAAPGMSLKVQAANTPARAFYARHGWHETENGAGEYRPWLRCAAPQV